MENRCPHERPPINTTSADRRTLPPAHTRNILSKTVRPSPKTPMEPKSAGKDGTVGRQEPTPHPWTHASDRPAADRQGLPPLPHAKEQGGNSRHQLTFSMIPNSIGKVQEPGLTDRVAWRTSFSPAKPGLRPRGRYSGRGPVLDRGNATFPLHAPPVNLPGRGPRPPGLSISAGPWRRPGFPRKRWRPNRSRRTRPRRRHRSRSLAGVRA